MVMSGENIFKIWGERRRILLTSTAEIDLLYLKKDSFCSTHSHKSKINKFVVISGRVRIETEYDCITLTANESWIVEPPMVHRFFAEEDSVMVELAYVEKGKIDPFDIDRFRPGGRVINGQERTIDQLKQEGLLGL
jgi:mannose-6-phosphate isomerase-like protein (cupin superfamily)